MALSLPVDTFAGDGVDLHRMWDDRCAECHGHSADFARKYLSVSGNKLLGLHHTQNLKRFMHNHYVAESEVDAVYDMLRAQVSSPLRFKSECGRCHSRAAEFVRQTLRLQDNILYSRNSGSPVDLFLVGHSDMGTDDVGFFTELLTRVAREVGQP